MSERKTSNLVVIKQVITNLWCQEWNLEYFRKLVDFMAKRLQMVIKNNGCMILFINMWFISIKNSFDNEIICLLCFIYNIGVGPKSICGGSTFTYNS